MAKKVKPAKRAVKAKAKAKPRPAAKKAKKPAKRGAKKAIKAKAAKRATKPAAKKPAAKPKAKPAAKKPPKPAAKKPAPAPKPSAPARVAIRVQSPQAGDSIPCDYQVKGTVKPADGPVQVQFFRADMTPLAPPSNVTNLANGDWAFNLKDELSQLPDCPNKGDEVSFTVRVAADGESASDRVACRLTSACKVPPPAETEAEAEPAESIDVTAPEVGVGD